MNTKIVKKLGLALIPVGALLLTACGPQEEINNEELALDQASDQFAAPCVAPCIEPWVLTEWGRCDDGYDNDGNGLVDSEDPACGVLGPIRDLSLHGFPIGHNFAPDLALYANAAIGGFRDRALITEWFRFLTEPDGSTAGITLMGPGVNNDVVPVPMPVAVDLNAGTFAQGNNNNVDPVDLHENFLFPHGLDGVAPAVAPVAVGAVGEYVPDFYNGPRSAGGGWPGGFYKGGSQGYLQKAAMGNPDGRGGNSGTPTPQ